MQAKPYPTVRPMAWGSKQASTDASSLSIAIESGNDSIQATLTFCAAAHSIFSSPGEVACF
jgi:hypothetical protein